jgi:hypothetical protein
VKAFFMTKHDNIRSAAREAVENAQNLVYRMGYNEVFFQTVQAFGLRVFSVEQTHPTIVRVVVTGLPKNGNKSSSAFNLHKHEGDEPPPASAFKPKIVKAFLVVARKNRDIVGMACTEAKTIWSKNQPAKQPHAPQGKITSWRAGDAAPRR